MKNHRIKLGDKVKCLITGYVGIVVARVEFLNGCIQYSVASKVNPKDNKLPMEGEPSIDEISLKVLKRKVILSKEYEDEEKDKPKVKLKIKKEVKSTGGPTRFMGSMRGY